METNPKNLKIIRQKLRTYGTPSEAALWTHIKNRQQENIKFRRQFGIDHYILDFYAPEIKLSIELDGSVHNSIIADEYDFVRTEFLKAQGITEIRFGNDDIQHRLNDVIETIKTIIKELKQKNR